MKWQNTFFDVLPTTAPSSSSPGPSSSSPLGRQDLVNHLDTYLRLKDVWKRFLALDEKGLKNVTEVTFHLLSKCDNSLSEHTLSGVVKRLKWIK